MQELMISLRKLRSALRWFRNKGFEVEIEYIHADDHYDFDPDSDIEKIHGVIDNFIVERNEGDNPSFRIFISLKNGKVFEREYLDEWWEFYGEYNPLEIKMRCPNDGPYCYLTIRKL